MVHNMRVIGRHGRRFANGVATVVAIGTFLLGMVFAICFGTAWIIVHINAALTH